LESLLDLIEQGGPCAHGRLPFGRG